MSVSRQQPAVKWYENIVPHPTHYYSDGSFCFIVQNYIFRVYKDLLSRRSEVMKNLFSLPQSSQSSRSSSPYDKPPSYAYSADQQMIEGVPAVKLDDDVEDFSNLLDIILPGSIALELDQYSFDQLAGIVRLCDKYMIEDVRVWALSWINSILPSAIDEIPRLGLYWGDASLIVRVITFARSANLYHYIPLALYTLAFHQWSVEDSDAFILAHGSLSIEDQHRIHIGRVALQQLVLEKASALPDLGLIGRHSCHERYGTGHPCRMAEQDGRKEPMELVAALLRGPLEVLQERVEHPPRTLCNKCTMAYVGSSSLLRAEVYDMLPHFFLLNDEERSSKL